jgi:hypothetical protein
MARIYGVSDPVFGSSMWSDPVFGSVGHYQSLEPVPDLTPKTKAKTLCWPQPVMDDGDLAVGHSGGVRDPRRARHSEQASRSKPLRMSQPQMHASARDARWARKKGDATLFMHEADLGSHQIPTNMSRVPFWPCASARDARWARVSDPDRVPDR